MDRGNRQKTAISSVFIASFMFWLISSAFANGNEHGENLNFTDITTEPVGSVLSNVLHLALQKTFKTLKNLK